MNSELITLIAAGGGVGFIMGLTGAGGGILSVPLLVMLMHIPLQQAAPVALVAIALSATVAALIALKRGQLRYRAAGFMAVFGLVAAPAGTWLSNQLPAHPLQIAFGSLMILLALRNQWPRLRGAETAEPPCRRNPDGGRLVWTNPCARRLAASGLSAGFMAGLLGVGGGFVLVPALRRYTDLDPASIVATSLGVLALVTGGSAVMASVNGLVSAQIAAPFVAGALMGLAAGKLAEPRLPAVVLTTGFNALSATTGLLLIIRSLP